MKQNKIKTSDLIEILDRRTDNLCKTVDHKLYELITHKQLCMILEDCGIHIIKEPRTD